MANPAPVTAPQPLRILVADDDAVNLLIVTAILRRQGHTPVAVENGREAIEAVRDGAFDLVLMDMQMPVMDGRMAIKAIRDAEEGTGVHTLVISLTAEMFANQREACLATGGDAYVAKPITPAALFAAIRSLVS
jgi:two-component system, sensor histidine kinase and response regulator